MGKPEPLGPAVRAKRKWRIDGARGSWDPPQPTCAETALSPSRHRLLPESQPRRPRGHAAPRHCPRRSRSHLNQDISGKQTVPNACRSISGTVGLDCLVPGGRSTLGNRRQCRHTGTASPWVNTRMSRQGTRHRCLRNSRAPRAARSLQDERTRLVRGGGQWH